MDESLELLEVYDNLDTGLKKVAEHFKNEMIKVRAGRANPAILNRLMVDYYGTPTPLPQMSNISAPEARMLLISVWDASMVKAVSKAIQASDIGINPSDDGKVIRLVFPQLTEERRRDLVKQVKKTAEESKVALRNERRDAIDSLKKLKKDNLLTEDDLALAEKEVQKETDKAIEIIEKLLKDKEAEIMEI